MKRGRNRICPCGSGLKFKKCCLSKAPALEAHSFVRDDLGTVIPITVVDDVVNAFSSMSDHNLGRRLDALAESQPNLSAFITPMDNSLPPYAAFHAALAAYAIIWMFESYCKQQLPQIGESAIRQCLQKNARSLFDFDDLQAALMSGRHQPSLYRFIGEIISDLDDGELDAFGAYTLFVMLKTTVDVLHDAASRLVPAHLNCVDSAAAP